MTAAVDTNVRHIHAATRRMSFFYVVKSAGGETLSTRSDMGESWDDLNSMPDARELVDDAGRLLAFRGKWIEAGAEIDPANVTERAGGRRVRR